MDIQHTVNTIRNASLQGKTTEELRKIFKSFYEEYPMLFEKSCDVTFSLKYLDWMIEMSKKLDTNSSAEKIKEMDGIVYGKLQEEYTSHIK